MEIGQLGETDKSHIVRLLADPVFELIQLPNTTTQATFLPIGARVSLTASPRHTPDETLDLASELTDRGFRVTPHLSARLIEDETRLTGLLDRIDAMGIGTVFAVGGDRDGTGTGGFADGVALTAAISEQAPHLGLGVPCYPEGHPDIPPVILATALKEKQQHASWMTSQMTFDASAVVDWSGTTRRKGVDLPLIVGMTGVVDRIKLIRIAARIGVGASLGFLRQHKGIVNSILRPEIYDPTRFVGELAPYIDAMKIVGVHIYTFNDCESTEAWRQQMLDLLAD